MKILRIFFYPVIILLATTGYTLFIKLSSDIATILVEQMGASPGILFTLTVKPHVFWIAVAWLGFLILVHAHFRDLNNNDQPGSRFNNYAVIFILWMGTATLWHLAGLIAPFISRSYIIS